MNGLEGQSELRRSEPEAGLSDRDASTTRWLVLQDLCRRKAQQIRRTKHRLHFVALGVALLMPLTPAAEAVTAGLGYRLESISLTGVLGFLFVIIELSALLSAGRAAQLNLLSRTALAWALPAEAFGKSVSRFQWIMAQRNAAPDVTAQDIESVLRDADAAARFEQWWSTERPRGEGRLRAMLLENVWWTAAIMEAAERRRLRLWRSLIMLLITVLVLGVIMTPTAAQLLTETVFPPVLAFLLAVTGAGLLVTHEPGRSDIEALRTVLRGSDHWVSSDSAEACSMLATYLALTAHLAPISSELYDAEREKIQQQTTHRALEAWLHATD